MGLFNTRNTKPQIEERIVMPTNYNWGMTMRNYCQQEEFTLEDLAELLNSGNVNSFNKSLSLSPVFAAISLISNAIASLPIYIKKNRNIIYNHNINVVMDNNIMSKFNLIKNLVTDVLYHGNAFAYLKRTSGIITDIIYLPVGDVFIDYDKYRHTLSYKVTGYYDIPNVIEPKDILHFKKDTDSDGIIGKGFKDFGLKAIRELQQVTDAAGVLYKDGLQTAGFYSAEQPLTQKQQKEILETIKEQQSSGNRQVFLPVKYSFISAGNTATDSQLIENRIFSIQNISRYFNISPILLGDLSKGNTNSVEEANLLFLSNCLLPILTLFESEMTRKMLSDGEIIDFDEKELLRTSQVKQSSYLSTLVKNGIMTIDEARTELGLTYKEDTEKLIIPYTDINQNIIGNNQNKD